MYARINYVDIKPESFQAIDKIWREVVESYASLVKGYFLRNGSTPHTLSIVLFETEEAMDANTQQLGVVVKRVAEHRLSEPEVHRMEVCASVPSEQEQAIGCVRVFDTTFRTEHMPEIISRWPEDMSCYREESGFRGARFCCNRETGQARSVSFWGSRADVDNNENSGILQAVFKPYQRMITAGPVPSYWDVRLVVG